MAPVSPASDAPKPHRLFVSGISASVTQEQLAQRFSPFGPVADVELAQPAGRGFGHLTLTTTDAQLRRCVNAYRGAKWAGGVIKVEEAKPGYKERLKKEWKEAEAASGHVKVKKKRKRKGRRDAATLAEDMSLVGCSGHRSLADVDTASNPR